MVDEERQTRRRSRSRTKALADRVVFLPRQTTLLQTQSTCQNKNKTYQMPPRIYLPLRISTRRPPPAKITSVSVSPAQISVSVPAAPIANQANEAVTKYIASVLGCPNDAVQIVRGVAARRKVLAVDIHARGEGDEGVWEKLKAAVRP